jgi:Calcineurin-like phosphoesterase
VAPPPQQNGGVNIQLLSDLHLESHPHFQPQPAPGADVLVLAGDIGSYQDGSALAALGIEDFGLARFSPLPRAEGGAAWPVPVLFIPGNHEYDGLDFDAAHARLQAACRRWGITWLERQTQLLGGVRFVGCTLWTDFDALLAAQPDATPAERLKAREKAFRAANYYLKKNHATRGGLPMLAPELRAEALAAQAWLRQALAAPFDGPTVAVTHFAPTLGSVDPRYGLVPGTAGFCNALDDLLPLATLWLHGHLHAAFDYHAGGCRVVANPLGYAGKGEQQAFMPRLCIPVPQRQAGPALSFQ